MADNKDICKWLEKIADQAKIQNKLLKQIADALEQKQFSELPPPPQGQVYQNMLGAVVVNRLDFEELVRKSDTEVTE